MDYSTHSPDMTYADYSGRVFDADHHLYEGEDAFTRYLPAEYRGLVRLAEIDGRKKMIVRGRVSEYIPNPSFEVVAAPGSSMDYFGNKNTEGKSYRELVVPMKAIPEFFDPDARLALMDRMHLDSIVNFPTLASLIEVNFMDDPVGTEVLVHAFNQWLYDEWGFDHKGRIFTTPVMNLSIPELAVQELEWALERGAKTVLVRPAPVAGYRTPRSPFLPDNDPFWAAVQDADIPVMMHVSDSGYERFADQWTGTVVGERRPFEQDVFSSVSQGHRPIMDTIYSAVCHGMLTRFPGVRLVSVENGGVWMRTVVEELTAGYGKMPQCFAEHPLETLRRALYVAPYWEEPLEPLIDAIGLDHIVFNSDWPHPEGLADPNEYAVYAGGEAGLPDEDVARIMGGNLYELMGV
jgi:predicted TIM-barrel fold metal-dependent hydrolase